MKLRTLLLLLTVCIVAAAAEDVKIPRPPTNWKPIFGFKHPTSKAYVDTNSLGKTITEKGEYVSGALLLVSNEATTLQIEGKPTVVRSVVKHMVVDCKSRLMVPVMDFYFNVEKPDRMNLPIAGLEYPTDAKNAELLSKSSLIYQAFCPVYI